MTIQKVYAREILDSRGNPTVEVDLELASGARGRAAVPSGASTGAHEAHELRDRDKGRFLGKGVLKAIGHVNKGLANNLMGVSFSSQKELDGALISYDGTENKSHCGANAILGISLAFAKARAREKDQFLFKSLVGDSHGGVKLPVPLMNVLNGGAHANNAIDIQEFMLAPVCGGSFKESLRAGCEVFQHLKKLLNERGHSTAVGDEGGFAPRLKSNKEALDYVVWAVEKAGYRLGEDIKIALDVAATEFFKGGVYEWESQRLSAQDLGEIYRGWANQYPLVSIEDGFSEDDWDGWKWFTQSDGGRMQLVGDDLFVTHTKRLQRGITEGAANSILIKVNQTGTLTGACEAVSMAREAGFTTIMSHRSGETEDAIIADLAVALGSQQIKTGSSCRGERTAKYNQLLRIEEVLGSQAEFWGTNAFLRYTQSD